MHVARHRRFLGRPANDNRTPAFGALRALGGRGLERLLGVAGALRFGLLLAGV
jgi:hypothetical protein